MRLIKKHISMRHNSLLALCLLLAAFATAQSDSSSNRKTRFEGGLHLYSFTLRPGDFHTRYAKVNDHQVFGGVYFRMHRGRHALRSELMYSKRQLRFAPGALYGLPTTSFELKLGYQYAITRGRLAWYAFADAGFDHFRQRQNYYYYPSPLAENLTVLPYYDPYNSHLLNGSQFSVSPGMGLSWKMGKHLVLSYEASAQFFYARQRPQLYYNSRIYQLAGINAKTTRLTLGFLF